MILDQPGVDHLPRVERAVNVRGDDVAGAPVDDDIGHGSTIRHVMRAQRDPAAAHDLGAG